MHKRDRAKNAPFSSTAPEPSEMNFFVYVASARESTLPCEGSRETQGSRMMVMMTKANHRKVRGVPLRELISCWMERPESMLTAVQGQLRRRTLHGRMQTSLYRLRSVAVPSYLPPSLPLSLTCSAPMLPQESTA